MCGIVGYTGGRDASNVLIDSLKKLEYRGYDSSGLAVIDVRKEIRSIYVEKSPGYISELESSLEEMTSGTGISHTRWATHGPPNRENAHPHVSGDGSIAVVHNGIIDNHHSLKQNLKDKGYEFLSETDSEVIPHLIQEEYETNNRNLLEAVRSSVKQLDGSYAILAVHKDHPEEVISVREKSPMVLGKGVNENFVASDVTALLKYTDSFMFMGDGEIARITPGQIEVSTLEGETVEQKWTTVDWNLEDAEKGGFKHYMIKEIHEQPRSLHQSLAGWKSDEDLIPRDLVTTRSISIVACGTSYHAGMVGKYLFEKFTGLPTSVSMASEYRFADTTVDDPLMIFITQSGETLDTIMAAREARGRGLRTISITNVVGSTITRETDITFYLRSGPEIGVAASKTFTSQLVMMYLLSTNLGYSIGRVKREEFNKVQDGIRTAIRSVERILKNTKEIEEMADWFSESHSAFYLGRYLNFPSALEGALKMKEISYIHCEGYPAGELKHGPLALLTDKTPVIALLSDDHTINKILGNIGECSARGSPVLAISPEGQQDVKKYTDRVLTYPKVDPVFSPIPIAVILQLLAYYAADKRGCSIDKPRNLAKSVTVE